MSRFEVCGGWKWQGSDRFFPWTVSFFVTAVITGTHNGATKVAGQGLTGRLGIRLPTPLSGILSAKQTSASAGWTSFPCIFTQNYNQGSCGRFGKLHDHAWELTTTSSAWWVKAKTSKWHHNLPNLMEIFIEIRWISLDRIQTKNG